MFEMKSSLQPKWYSFRFEEFSKNASKIYTYTNITVLFERAIK